MTVFRANIGSAPGLEVWRIENMNPVEVENAHHGEFHSGDSYIILKTTEKGKGNFTYDVHFWLGEETSQDEMGAAAYRTVELDDQLNGKPVQHREVQGHESPLFLSYFQDGIKYLTGGVQSGFHHVDRNAFDTHLYQCKGKRSVRVREVPLSSTSLNQGDVFILDMGMTIYQWNGRQSNKYEKFKGLEVVTKIRNQQRGGKANVVPITDGGNDDVEEFWKALGVENGKRAEVKTSNEGGSDDNVDTSVPLTLHKIEESADGEMGLTLIASNSLNKSLLSPHDVFIVDSSSAVFVWVGKNAPKSEKSKGMSYASEYLRSKNRPMWTPLSMVLQNSETPIFKCLFVQWDLEPSPGEEKVYKKAEAKLITDALYKKQAAAEQKIASLNGKLKGYRVENLQLKEIDANELGNFYNGDSYVINFEYRNGNTDAHITYFWQGRDSSQDEKAASAFFAVEIDSKSQGMPCQSRIVSGKEPQHFLALFKGKFVVHNGGVASGFHNRKGGQSSGGDGSRLYHVKGTSPLNTHAVAVHPSASSLNSGDSFILVDDGHNTSFVWFGEGSNDDEKKFAEAISAVVAGGRAVTKVSEGSESDAFWAALGGQGEYAKVRVDDQHLVVEPRFFDCHGVTGDLILEEVLDYSQDDLQHDCVVILDCVSEVFVWVGNDARAADKENSMKAAQQFVANAPDGRSKDTPVTRINAGSEPPAFSCHFHGWSAEKATDFRDPYETRLKQLKEKGEEKTAAPSVQLKKTELPSSPSAASTSSTPAPSVQLKKTELPSSPSPASTASTPAPSVQLKHTTPTTPSSPPPSTSTYAVPQLKATPKSSPPANAASGSSSPSVPNVALKSTGFDLTHKTDSDIVKQSSGVSIPNVQLKSSNDSKSGYAEPKIASFSYAELSGSSCPSSVDPKMKEQYLSDSEFSSLFKMSKADFDKLQPFKKSDLKQKLKL